MSGLRLFNLKGGVTEVVPRLAEAEAEAAVAHLPQPENSRTLTAFAAGLGGYWEKASRRPAPLGIPFLRAHQVRAAEAARAWLRHRTEWE